MFDLVLDSFIPIDYNDVMVEVEALSLTVEQEYSQLYCYVGLASNPAERVPDAGSFIVSNTYEWNLADYLGGCNKASLVVPQDQDLTVYLECFGLNKSSNYPIPLGFYKHSHPSADWNGQIFEGVSEDGEGFVVTYRINQAAGPLVAPINLQESRWGGTTYLQWVWEGNQNDIDGFKIYRNENLIATVNPEYSLLEIPSWWTVPPCQEEYTYKVTAYQDELESAPSNDLNYQGDLCGDENDIIDLQSQSICENAGRRFDVTYHYQSPHGLANVEIRAFENGDLIDAIQSTRPQIQYGDGTVQVALMNHSDEYYVTDQIMVTLSDQNGQPFYVETFDQFESWVPVMPDLTISDAWVDWELNKVHVQIENIACAGPPTSPPLVSLIPETDDRILEKNATSEIPARTYKMVHFDLPLDEIGPNENIWTGEIRVLVDRWDSIEESENENNEFTISPAVSSSIYWEGLQFTEIEVFDDHDRYSDGEWDLNVKIGRFHNGNIESATEYGGTYDTYGHRYNWGEGVHSLNITFSPYLEQNDALVFKVYGYEREFYQIPEYGGDYLGKAFVYHSPDGVEIPVLEDHGYIHMGSWKNGGTFAVWSDKYDYKITYQIIINN
jgi:hypothetical protein